MPNPLSGLLHLIAATILADKRFYASDGDTFIKEARAMILVRQLEPKLSEARLLSWFELNKGAVQENLKAPYFKDWYYNLLKQLSDVPDKKSILDVMHKISSTDDKVHESGRALIILAERYWKYG